MTNEHDPVPFTEGELLAARLRIAVQDAAAALADFRRAWNDGLRVEARRLAKARRRGAEEQEKRRKRIDAAELHLRRAARLEEGPR